MMISFLDRMVEFRRCSEVFNFAHKRHRIEKFQVILLICLNFWWCLASTFESALTFFSRICSTPLCDCSVDTELVRGKNNSIKKVNIAILLIETDGVSFIFLLSIHGPAAWNTGYPEFSKSSTICEARRSHLPPWLVAYPWYHLLSSPSPCPSLHFDAYSLTFIEVRAQESSLFSIPTTMSLNIVRRWWCWKECNKLCHSSRVKLPFVRMSASWFFGFDILDLDSWVQVDSVNSPEHLGGCGTHVSSSDFCLWWSSLSQLRCLRICRTVILSQRDVRSKELDFCLIDPSSDPTLVILCAPRMSTLVSRVHDWVGFGIRRFIPSTSITKPTSKNAQNFALFWFWVFKISRKIRILKQSQSALFSSIAHMTILFVFTCMMNVRDLNEIIVNLRAHFRHFSNGFQFFFFEMMVVNAWSWYFVELLSRLVCQLTISFHTFLCMTLHIIRPWRNTKILREWQFLWSPCGKFAIQTWLCNCPPYLCLFPIVFECIPTTHDLEKMLVLPNQLLWVISSSDQDFVSFQPISCQPHTQVRIILFHDFENFKQFVSIFNFFLGKKLILRPLLVLRILAFWKWYPWFWLLSFVMLMILVHWKPRIVFYIGVQLDLCIFGALPPTQHSSNDRCLSVEQNELLRPTSLLHRSPLIYLWLSSGSTPKCSPIFPIPCPPLLSLQEFSELEAWE